MHKQFIVPLCLTLLFSTAFSAQAQMMEPEEKAFLDKHMGDIVTTFPSRLADASVVKVFAAPIYNITITVNSGDGGNSIQQQLAARVGDKLVPLSRPGTDGDCPSIQKMLKPDFALKTDDDAKALQSAFDLVFPTITDEEKKAVSFRHTGKEWTFIRGKFFDKKMGFVVTTDDKGAITAVKYSLSLAP